MILSQKNNCATKFGELRAIELIAKAGFDAIDYTMSTLAKDGNVLDSDNYKMLKNTTLKLLVKICGAVTKKAR